MSFGATFGTIDLIILAVSAVALILVQLFIKKSRAGLAIRGASFSLETASIMGINTQKLIMIVFLIAGALAGLAGALLGAKYTAYPALGTNMANKAFISSVVGGLGSITGAVIGALILGIGEVLISGYLSSAMRDIFSYTLLVIILSVKTLRLGWGWTSVIGHKEGRDAGILARCCHSNRHLHDRRPWYVCSYRFYRTIFSWSCGLHGHWRIYISLVTKTYGIPNIFGVISAMAAALIVGLLIGYPTLKLKGDYFVIATLGIGQATKLIIEKSARHYRRCQRIDRDSSRFKFSNGSYHCRGCYLDSPQFSTF